MASVNILGNNYLLSNPISGTADPSTGYTNSASLNDVQQRLHSDGALYQMNNGKGGDSFTFNSGNGSAIFCTDAGDNVKLTGGNWTDSKQYVTDKLANGQSYSGELYTDDKGNRALISGQGTVTCDNSTPSNGIGAHFKTKDEVAAVITKIENDPAVKGTGGDPDGKVTKDEINKAINDGTLTGDDKTEFQNVANNFNSFDKTGKGVVNADDVASGFGIATKKDILKAGYKETPATPIALFNEIGVGDSKDYASDATQGSTVVNMNTGTNANFTVSNKSGMKNGHAVLKGDTTSKVALQGSGWTETDNVTDSASGINGKLYTDGNGNEFLITGGAQVNITP